MDFRDDGVRLVLDPENLGQVVDLAVDQLPGRLLDGVLGAVRLGRVELNPGLGHLLSFDSLVIADHQVHVRVQDRLGRDFHPTGIGFARFHRFDGVVLGLEFRSS